MRSPVLVTQLAHLLKMELAQASPVLQAKIAKLKRELLEPVAGSGGGSGERGFDVHKVGDARVGFVGEILLSSPAWHKRPVHHCNMQIVAF